MLDLFVNLLECKGAKFQPPVRRFEYHKCRIITNSCIIKAITIVNADRDNNADNDNDDNENNKDVITTISLNNNNFI
jgi:hypothetical protein